VQDAIAASPAKLDKKARLGDAAIEARINPRINGYGPGKTVSEKIHPDTAGSREDKVVRPDLLVKRLKKLGLAVALDSGIIDLHVNTFLCRLHAQHGRDDLSLFAASGMTDRHARIAAVDKDLFEVLHHTPYFIKRFLLAYYHGLSTPLFDGFVKSPYAAMRFTLRRCDVPAGTPHSSGFERLASRAF
jgi:hypothetical protein